MNNYKNLSGKSQIVGYEIGDDYIIVKFEDREHQFYKYTISSAGKENIECMKHLANQGNDLNAFIDINTSEICEHCW